MNTNEQTASPLRTAVISGVDHKTPSPRSHLLFYFHDIMQHVPQAG